VRSDNDHHPYEGTEGTAARSGNDPRNAGSAPVRWRYRQGAAWRDRLANRLDRVSTFALSVAGFVLAVIANLWNFGLTSIRWPRVSVETRSHLYVTAGPPKDKIELTVINRGSEAVTISNIGLRAVDDGQARDYARDDADYPDRLPESHHDPLPLRIEGHGALRWVYGPHQLAEFREGIEVKGYAKAYRSFRWPWTSSGDLSERTIEARRSETIRR
jgi:hypothetical protein